MTTPMTKFYSAVLAFSLASPVFAEDTPTEKSAPPLTGETELGVITTSGNTETQSYKGKIDIKQETNNWRNRYILEGLYKRDKVVIDDGSGTITEEETTTAEKYFGSAQGDYKLDAKYAALFIYGDYDRNRFSGFDYQATFALGYSNRLFTNDSAFLGYSVGPGVSYDKPEPIDGVKQDSEESFVIRFSANYERKLSESAKFTQSVSSNYATDSDNNTKTKSITSLTAQLNTSLALRASYTVDYNSQVPPEREHADTETAITVVYSF